MLRSVLYCYLVVIQDSVLLSLSGRNLGFTMLYTIIRSNPGFMEFLYFYLVDSRLRNVLYRYLVVIQASEGIKLLFGCIRAST